jgi:hypothetical protein
MRVATQAWVKLGTILAGAAAVVSGWLLSAVTVLGASPSPTAASGGDPRSSGQGPGLVGDPAFALLAVVAIGLASVLLTLAYVRLTATRGA